MYVCLLGLNVKVLIISIIMKSFGYVYILSAHTNHNDTSKVIIFFQLIFEFYILIPFCFSLDL